MSTIIKGSSPKTYDGSNLRIAIVHARWNKSIVDALVEGAILKLKECGVADDNIVVQSVPGSFELPLACARYPYNTDIAPSFLSAFQGDRGFTYSG